MKKAVFYFCPDPALDVVATNVLEILKSTLPLKESGVVIDNLPAYTYTDPAGNRFDFVSMAYYFSHRYETYLPIVNEHYADCDVAGYINWHGGANAPDKVLTVHTIGDVMTGRFAPAHPGYLRALARALEEGRIEKGLLDFTVHTEATHWSGAIHGSDPALIEDYPVPLFDIEVGSAPETLENRTAAEVLAGAILKVFEPRPEPKVILCLGGIHFDDNYSKALLQEELPISIGHFLPTLWLVNGDYSGERGMTLLRHAMETIPCQVDAIVFNDNMKKHVKDCVRAFAAETGLPLLKHRRLHAPLEIEW